MQSKKALIWIIVLLLLLVDFLTFHDLLEPHTTRDWLTLLSSMLVFYYFAKELKKQVSTIRFEAKLYKIGSWTILRLPEEASAKLPSRGMIMVSGTINGVHFKTLLEPDGRYGHGKKPSHWFAPSKKLLDNAHAKEGDTVQVSIEPTKQWIEPEVPVDLKKALATSPKAEALWQDITPSARWDWIRWIRAVKTPQTREKHIEVALSKLNKGMRRPCCFNRNLCSEPYVSNNWVLLGPT